MGWEVEPVESGPIPQCLKCNRGELVPLSDYGSQGATVHYKAWVCTNPDCGFNIKIRNGDIYLNEPIASGAAHLPRPRS
jgi:hypothetical protein